MQSIQGITGIFVVSSGQTGIRGAFGTLHPERRPAVVIYDQTPKNEKLLRDDLADFLIDQSGFEQGYRPLHILANAVGRGILPDRKEEHTEISIRTRYNL
jgi:LacI family transcriptional regulator